MALGDWQTRRPDVDDHGCCSRMKQRLASPHRTRAARVRPSRAEVDDRGVTCKSEMLPELHLLRPEEGAEVREGRAEGDDPGSACASIVVLAGPRRPWAAGVRRSRMSALRKS